ncbi:MAG TPA: prephenate dehydrogenase/arogenate dehydrogenase family protein, partial [Arthrobacter sp.]|nr:prephenate dehydrogenase/arogenate dehydrogenase family protein [Arthrobacter sp.]
MSAFRTHGRGHLNGPVVVVGTGLLGTSIGLGLRGRGVAVFLSDPSPTNQAVAVDIGAGLPLARLDGEQPELVVVAAPPDVTADVVERALADFPEATVVDIASVKAGIQAELRSRGADLSRYVGTHPMAGREKSGPVAARGELFTSMPWVLCPSGETLPRALQTARALAVDLGAIVSE